jgi:hypothetical protein
MTLATRHRPTGRLRFSDGSRSTLKGAAREFGARSLTTFYRRMLFLAYQLEGVRIPTYSPVIETTFGTLSPRDVDSYLGLRPDTPRSEVERRLGRGDRCFVSWAGNRIVDACWSATGSVYVPYLARFLHVPDGDIYSYDSYTLPAYRGRGLYMARNSYTAQANQAEGFRRSIALVAFENYSAWLILTRSGLRTLGAYHYLRLPARGIYWTTTEPGQSLPSLSTRRNERSRQMQTLELQSET